MATIDDVTKRRSNAQLALFATVGFVLGVILTPMVIILYYSVIIAWNLGPIALLMFFGIPLFIPFAVITFGKIFGRASEERPTKPPKYTWHGVAAVQIGFTLGSASRMLARYMLSSGTV
jgi:hypothetical protein